MKVQKLVKSALESLMFVWGQPLSIRDAAKALDIDISLAKEGFLQLQRQYEEEERGIRIRQVGKAFQMVTAEENNTYITRLCSPVKMKKLSQSALEVLAIIAYKQPVTKSEIDSIRGVKCDRAIEGLLSKELICEKGRSDGIGRPILYGTTELFLEKFGFSTIKELPEIDNFQAMEEDSQQITLEDLGSLRRVKNNIVLIGMPACGKTTIGMKLSDLAGKTFVDTDLLIEEREKLPLQDIINIYGNKHFRSVEEEVLKGFRGENSVISTGGSAVYYEEAMKNLKSLGKVVYIKVSYENIEKRLDNLETRGVTFGKGQSLLDLYNERCPLYEKYADYIVDGDDSTIETTAEEICGLCREEE